MSLNVSVSLNEDATFVFQTETDFNMVYTLETTNVATGYKQLFTSWTDAVLAMQCNETYECCKSGSDIESNELFMPASFYIVYVRKAKCDICGHIQHDVWNNTGATAHHMQICRVNGCNKQVCAQCTDTANGWCADCSRIVFTMYAQIPRPYILDNSTDSTTVLTFKMSQTSQTHTQ